MAHIRQPGEPNKTPKKNTFAHKLKSLIDTSQNGMATLRKKQGIGRGK